MTSVVNRFFRAYGRVALVAAAAAACSSTVETGGDVESIVVSPSAATVAVGSQLTLGAEVRDADGNLLPGVRVTWASEDAALASVSQSGVVTGLGVGTVRIAASARGKDAFASLTISPTAVASVRLSTLNQSMFVGETLRIVAQPVDGAGNVLPGRAVTFSSSNASVATVTSDGLVSAIATGGAIITAMSEGRSAVASITVSLVPVASIDVSPRDNEAVVGQSTRLTVVLRDASGTILTDRVVVWSTSDAQIATVTSQGVVTAVAPGSAIISAAIDGRSALATVNVTARPASAVIVSPGQVTIFSGQTLQLSSIVTDDRGQVLTGRTVAYASGDPQVATVSVSGMVTGVTAGSVIITATSEGASGTATVTVAPEPVFSVSVSPATATLAVGQPLQLAVIARNGSGQSLSLAGRSVGWSTSTPAITSVSSSGMVTALSVGTGVVIATVDGKQGSAQITVKVVPVVSISVTPSTASVVVGGTTTLTAIPRDSAGQPLANRVIGWTSGNSSVATVNSSGVVTGVAAGSAVITASVEGKTGTATVAVSTVAQGQVANITISPSSATVNVAWTTTLSATARDANGNAIPGSTFTWSSNNASIASVSASGVVTGVAPGAVTIFAASGGKTGSAAITVQLAPVDHIVVTPSSPALDPGQTVQLTATLYDQQNNVLTGRTVTWSTQDATKATVNATGLVTAIKKGNVVITASSGGKSGTSTVRVQ